MQGQSGGVETLTKMRIQILLENFRGILQNLFYFFILILVDIGDKILINTLLILQ
jgi:hypothetical protein